MDLCPNGPVGGGFLRSGAVVDWMPGRANAVAGEVLMSRLREGRANTARGAAHFLRETVGRVRYGGARGPLTVRADSGFYTRPGRGLPRDGCQLLHHHPPARRPAEPDRGHTRRGLDADSLLDGRRRRRGRDHLHSLPE